MTARVISSRSWNTYSLWCLARLSYCWEDGCTGTRADWCRSGESSIANILEYKRSPEPMPPSSFSLGGFEFQEVFVLVLCRGGQEPRFLGFCWRWLSRGCYVE